MRFIADNDNFLDSTEPEIDEDDEPISAHITTTFEQREAARLRFATERQAEAKVLAPIRARIQKRQAAGSGWDGVANDNEVFPFLTTLRRRQDDGSIALVMRYRGLIALCAAQPLQGAAIGSDDPMSKEFVTRKMRGVAEVDAAAKAGEAEIVPGGDLTYKQLRKAKGGKASEPNRRAVAATQNTYARTASLGLKFTDEVLIRAIDAKPALGELRAALGPLLDAFEDAVLGGRTLAEIGVAAGYSKKRAEMAGDAWVTMALDTLRETWAAMTKREERRAADAETAVVRHREFLAERRRVFLAGG